MKLMAATACVFVLSLTACAQAQQPAPAEIQQRRSPPKITQPKPIANQVDGKSLNEWIDALLHGSKAERAKAGTILHRFGPQLYVQLHTARNRARNLSRDQQRTLFFTLRDIDKNTAMDPHGDVDDWMTVFVKFPDIFIRHANVLARFEDPAVAKLLEIAEGDATESLRCYALAAIKSIIIADLKILPTVSDDLIRLISSEDEPELIRTTAMRAFIDIGEYIHRHHEGNVEKEVRTALNSASPIFLAALEAEESFIRIASLQGLAVLPGPSEKVRRALCRVALDDDESLVRDWAVSSMIELQPQTKIEIDCYLEVLGKEPKSGTLSGYDNSARAKSLIGIGEAKPEADYVLPALIKMLEQDSWIPNRARAAETIGKLGPDAKAAIPNLLAAAQEDNDKEEFTSSPLLEVRVSALVALGRLRSREGIELLTTVAADDRDPYVRRAALRGLAGAGNAAREAIPTVEKISEEDQDPELQQLAEQAIKAIKQEP